MRMIAEKYSRVQLSGIHAEEYTMKPIEQVAACAVKLLVEGMPGYAARELLAVVIEPKVLMLGKPPAFIRTQIDTSELISLIDMATTSMSEDSLSESNLGLPATVKEILESISGEELCEDPSEGFLDYIVDCYRAVRYK